MRCQRKIDHTLRRAALALSATSCSRYSPKHLTQNNRGVLFSMQRTMARRCDNYSTKGRMAIIFCKKPMIVLHIATASRARHGITKSSRLSNATRFPGDQPLVTSCQRSSWIKPSSSDHCQNSRIPMDDWVTINEEKHEVNSFSTPHKWKLTGWKRRTMKRSSESEMQG